MSADSRGSFDPEREQGVEEAGVWIRDALGRAAGGFYHLGYSSVQPSAWSKLDDLTDETHLEEFRLVAEGLRAHGRKTEGLVVLVSDDQQDGRARCYLACQVARLLAEGGSRVLLLDGEFEGEGPADWLGDPDREGLLDVARYGASPRSTLQRSGLNKVDMMGVGSYRPRESDPLGEEELWSALHQLRAGWQFVLCTAPARTSDGAVNPLFPRCDGVLMGLMLEGEARDGFEELAEHLMEAEIPIFGVMAFPRAGQLPSGEEQDLQADGTASAAEDLASETSSDFSSGPVSPYASSQRSHRHESSRLFRRLTVGIAVVLLLFLGSWAAIQWTQRSSRETLSAVSHGVSKENGGTRGKAPPGSSGTESPASRTPGAVAPESTGTEASAEGLQAVPLDLEHAVLAGGTESSAEVAEETVEEVVPAKAGAEVAEETVEEAVAAETPVVKPATPQSNSQESDAGGSDAVFAEALRLRPQRGWALHPWSFRDSTQAVPSVRLLRSVGMDPIVVKADLGKKGIWYRVLVGNFSTRGDALQARVLLEKRRDVTDSVGVIRVGD